jgi:hypothetical protein
LRLPHQQPLGEDHLGIYGWAEVTASPLVMALRSLRLLRPSITFLQPVIPCIRPFHHRSYDAQSSAPEPQPMDVRAELTAQAELAAKAKVLSPYHKVSYDERKVRVPWQDGKTSALYVFPPSPNRFLV